MRGLDFRIRAPSTFHKDSGFMSILSQVWDYIGIDGIGAISVFIAACLMYLFFSLILYLWGERLKGSTAPMTVAVATLMGAIAARSILGDTPTIAGGFIALSTLLILERIFGVLKQITRKHLAHRHRN